MNTTKKVLVEITGGLGKPSKMPGLSYGISPTLCNVGSKLAKTKGTICSSCYACKGNYMCPSIKAAHEKRQSNLATPQWIDAMAQLITRETARIGEEYFRWHDSGDVQSLMHLEAIAEVCRRTAHVRHWLPTRERSVVKEYLAKHGQFPTNLVVRLSATYPDRPTPKLRSAEGKVGYSNVHKDKAPDGHSCPAYQQDRKCGSCRACWDLSNETVSYPLL